MTILEENARLVIHCQKGRRICEVSKNRLTFLLSGNVAVNCKLILLLFIMLKPQGPLWKLPKHYCLVMWSKPKPQPIFIDWVAITLYLKWKNTQNLPFEIPLVIQIMPLVIQLPWMITKPPSRWCTCPPTPLLSCNLQMKCSSYLQKPLPTVKNIQTECNSYRREECNDAQTVLEGLWHSQDTKEQWCFLVWDHSFQNKWCLEAAQSPYLPWLPGICES